MLDLLQQELLTFAKIKISGLFSGLFWDIDSKFDIWISHDIIQIEFVSSRSTFFYSYCPLLKFSFLDFSFENIYLKFGTWHDTLPGHNTD